MSNISLKERKFDENHPSGEQNDFENNTEDTKQTEATSEIDDENKDQQESIDLSHIKDENELEEHLKDMKWLIPIISKIKLEGDHEDFDIKKVIFKVHYQTLPDQNICMAGDDVKFNEWDETSLIIFDWTLGDYWIKEFEYEDLPDYSEYKLIFQNGRGEKIYENGDNR